MQFLKNRFVQAAGALAVIGVLALVTPMAAHGLAAALVQVTNTTADPVINQDRDSPARNYYQQWAWQSCAGACNLTFPTVPAGQLLVIQNISAQIISSGPLQQFIFQNFNANAAPTIYPAVTTLPGWSGTYIVNTPTLAYFSAGSVPGIIVGNNIYQADSLYLYVNISGYTINVP
jgi:hypothetical protein